MGYTKPTPIQELAIPIILSGKDIIACAQTGTGKTAAFLLPILNNIIKEENRHLNTLIIVPTRELAIQIDQQVQGLSYFLSVSSIAVYGGNDGSVWEQQKKALKEGADIVIATPGRLIAQLQSGLMNFKQMKHLVLDEADRMLDMGFNEDIMQIASYLPKEIQVLMFSATMPPKIRTLANKILKEPEQVNVAISKPAEGILQQAYVVYDSQKVPIIQQTLSSGAFKSVVIFAATKESVKNLNIALQKVNIPSQAFHSDLDQSEREEILRAFKGKQITVLVGTDIISRGIDVEGVDLVINYDVPADPEDYIHRIGRTARAESTGTAITFINEKDQAKFFQIESLIGKDIEKLVTPVSLGEVPLYQPQKKQERKFVPKKTFKKKGFSRNV
ncbi:MAG: DEAD/DEAH box helicase [Cytophagales bacterium]|nr:MAG: DEAD/DEAH box helicase [Cytophagales bacterium]